MVPKILVPFGWLGGAAVGVAAGVGRWGLLLVQATRATAHVSLWGGLLFPQLVRVGVESVPIALFVATFTGVVLALQASYTFTGAVPLYFVGTLVTKTMILELGPVLTGLALAGRVGANIAANLGTMRVTEQIDALETLGYDPAGYLVTPRVLAGIIMFPFVTALWFTSLFVLDMSTPEFVKGMRLFFEPFDIQYSMIKATSFGLTVTSVGCYFGFTASGGADGVGRAATQAVVVGSMAILVLDAFWAMVLL